MALTTLRDLPDETLEKATGPHLCPERRLVQSCCNEDGLVRNYDGVTDIDTWNQCAQASVFVAAVRMDRAAIGS